jgi:hypothetical protein
MSVTRRRTILALGFWGVLASAAAAQTTRPGPAGEPNPPAEGFDLEGSDAEAIAIADRVMEKMGGRAAWDAARHIAWNWFGREYYVWDKHTGAIRIEADDSRTGDPILVLMNVNDMTGRMWLGAEEVTDPELLAGALRRGKARWINAAYWMFMPYKLKDAGVTLRYHGAGTTETGAASDVLELTFSDVGVTPDNKYLVHVGRETGLVEQWDYFATKASERPDFKGPWANWQSYGGILLSDGRGPQGRHADIGVYDDLPDTVYTRATPTGLPNTVRARLARYGEGLARLDAFVGDWRCALMIATPLGPEEVAARWEVDWAFNDTYLRIEMHAPTARRPRFADPRWNRILYLGYDPDAEEYVATRLAPNLPPEMIPHLQSMAQRGGFAAESLIELKSTPSEDDPYGLRTEIRIYDERRFTLTDFRFRPELGEWRPVESYLLTKPRSDPGRLRPAPPAE